MPPFKNDWRVFLKLFFRQSTTTHYPTYYFLNSPYIIFFLIFKSKNEDGNENKTKSGDTWIRIITQGQELTIDCDEKTLAEMGFKDNQVKCRSIR